MNADDRRILAFVRARMPDLIAAIWLIPLAWVEFVPFDFSLTPSDGPAAFALPTPAAPIPDVISNVGLFFPAGMLLFLAMRYRGRRPALSMLGSMLCCTALAYTAEWSQQYSASRIASRADFYANVGGAFLGIVFAGFIRGYLRATVMPGSAAWRRLEDNLLNRPSGIAAKALAVLILLNAWLPFDITFSVDRLKQSVTATQLVPFAEYAEDIAEMQTLESEGDARTAQLARRNFALTGLAAIWAMASFAAFAALLRTFLRSHCAMSRATSLAYTVMAGLVLAATGSVFQVFLVSRDSSVTDLILAAVGTSCGAFCAQRLSRAWGTPWTRRFRGGEPRKRLLYAVLGGIVAICTARQLAPFNPATGIDYAAALANIEWLPMRTYQRALLPIAMADVFNKQLIYLAMGTVLMLVRANLKGTKDGRRFTWLAVLGAAAFAITTETAQAFIVGRSPAISDLLLAMTGVGLGAFTTRAVLAWTAEAEERRARISPAVVFNVELGQEETPVGPYWRDDMFTPQAMEEAAKIGTQSRRSQNAPPKDSQNDGGEPPSPRDPKK